MKKKIKGQRGSIEAFDAAARQRGMTYAQAQIEETCRMYQKRKRFPPDYGKAGERGSN